MMAKEEMVDVEINLGKKLADEINKMTKTELINRLVVLVLHNKVKDEDISRLERRVDALNTEASEATGSLEQAESMLKAAMNHW